MLDDLQKSALDYHRFPRPGKIEIAPTKPLATQRDLGLAYSPGVAFACEAIKEDPAEARNLTARGNLVGVVTNGTAVLGLGNIGPLAAKPVMEGKAVLFKKFAGIDVFDIELNEARPGPPDRGHRSARADVRRHQPRGHQGPGVLLHREEAAREAEDPGLPRRPARHGHHRGRGDRERPSRGGQGSRQREARGVRGGRGRPLLPRHARGPRREAREHLGLRHRGRGLRRPQGAHGRQQGALREEDRRAHARRHHRRRRRVPGPFRRRRPQAGHGEAHGGQPAHPRPGQPGARDPARGSEGRPRRRHHRHRPLGLPEPGEQRPVLPVHLPRRARRGCDDDQRADEARRRERDRGPRHRRAVRRGRHGLPAGADELRARIPHPEAVRSAPHREDRSGGGEGGHGERSCDQPDPRLRRLRAAPERVRLPLRPHHAARLRRGEGVPEAHRLRRRGRRTRAARGAGGGGREAGAPRSWSAGRRCSRSASSASAFA